MGKISQLNNKMKKVDQMNRQTKYETEKMKIYASNLNDQVQDLQEEMKSKSGLCEIF